MNADYSLLPSTVDGILDRVHDLRSLNQSHLQMRQVMRAVMNGGAQAVAHLVADSEMDYLPSANLVYSAMERLSQKMTRPPQVRVDAPMTSDASRARKYAEKRERIVEAWDRYDRLDMQMPQVARWTAGYGFAVWTLGTSRTEDGVPYPSLELRDPYECLPGPWTVHQQPPDVAFIRKVPLPYLRQMYGAKIPRIKRRKYSTGGAVLLDHNVQGWGGGWETQSDEDTARVIEYRNATGTYLILEETQTLLEWDHLPEGMGTPFVVAKRFAFDRLIGQYEHVIGLQQMLARMNILAFLSVQDAVFAETNVYGDMTSDEYRRGRGAVNLFAQGTRVERPTDANQFQSFQQIDRVERHLRLSGVYPVTDDSQSPNSFVTGRGLQELTQSSDNVVQEYQLVFKNALEIADWKRLKRDDTVHPDIKRPMTGLHRGAPYSESYKPSTHIAGNYHTRRVYGLLSGLDSSSKLIGLLQVAEAGWMDDITAMEHLDGIDNVQQVRERLERQKAENLLEQAMLALIQGQPANLEVLRILVDQLEPGPVKDKYEEVFFPQPEQPELGPDGQPVNPEEAELLANTEPLAEQGETPQAIISRLFATGGANANVRTIQETA